MTGQFVFGYDGGAATGTMGADRCAKDRIFVGGFQ